MIFPDAGQVRLRRIGPGERPGRSRAVIVEAGSLVHSSLMLPYDRSGKLVEGGVRMQIEQALQNLELVLRDARTGLENLVRLHIYAADDSVANEVDRFLAERFATDAPAVTLVESAMPAPGVLLALDAIAATAFAPEKKSPVAMASDAVPLRHPRASHVTVQPAGPCVIVSGRAAGGEFDRAIRQTMEQLRGDLERVGLTFADVVQVKAFVQEMAHLDRLEQIAAEYFVSDRVPAFTATEWRQDAVPAEIELIAVSTRRNGDGTRLELLDSIGGRFSRIARVNEGDLVFTSGLCGRSTDPREQVREIFSDLKELLAEAGSTMRHLAKATYYISDPQANRELDTIRPTVYDPNRPPAASKILVRGVGRDPQQITIDIIAVTAEAH